MSADGEQQYAFPEHITGEVIAAILRNVAKNLKSSRRDSVDCQLVFPLKKHPNGRVQLPLCGGDLAYLYCTFVVTHDSLAP
jgi:hypothetical protein